MKTAIFAMKLLTGAVAVACSALIAWFWMTMERDPGDTTVASSRTVRMNLSAPFVFETDSDGMSELVSGVGILRATSVDIEPCPLGGPICTVERHGKDPASVLIEPEDRPPAGEPARFRFMPLIRTSGKAQAPTSSCTAIDIQAEGIKPATLTMLTSDIAAGCSAALQTTILDSAPRTDGSDGLVLTVITGVLRGHEAPRKFALRCALPAASVPPHDECRITVRAELSQGSTTRVDFALRENPGITLFRNGEDAPFFLPRVRGTLARPSADDASPAQCRSLPGDLWEFTRADLRRLAISKIDQPTLQATVRGYKDVACRFPMKEFLFRFFVILGVPAMLEVNAGVRGRIFSFLRRRRRRTANAAPAQASPSSKGSEEP